MESVKSIKVGTVVFGAVGSYPPTRWRFEGVRRGAVALAHVKPAAQSVAYPDQYVSWDDLRRLVRW